MLTFTRAQMEVFQDSADAAFLKRLREERDREESLLPLELAGYIRDRIIAAGVARARAYGLTWEANLSDFIRYMFMVAPDFDGQARIHSGMTHHPDHADNVFENEIWSVPIPAWADAERNPSGAGWFLPLPLPRTQPAERIAAALPGAVVSRMAVTPDVARQHAEAGLAVASRCGLLGEDAAWVASVGVALFGAGSVQGVLMGGVAAGGVAGLRAKLWHRMWVFA